MKATFQDFLKENPTCGKYRDNKAAQIVFDLLSQDENLLAMLDAAERGQPALTPCARQAEACMLQIDDSAALWVPGDPAAESAQGVRGLFQVGLLLCAAGARVSHHAGGQTD